MRERRMHDAEQPGGWMGGRMGGWQRMGEGPGGEEFGPWGRGRHGRHGGGGERDRARRGDARYILLDALRDGPKHGYEIIKMLEERSGGRYVPSPGTVYPTLQYLEDEGLVRSSQEADRRIYQLTEAGQAELDTLAEQVNAFWKRMGGGGASGAIRHEMKFLHEELEQLNRTVWGGLRPAIAQGQTESIRQVRAAVEECQNKIRAIIAAEQPK